MSFSGTIKCTVLDCKNQKDARERCWEHNPSKSKSNKQCSITGCNKPYDCKGLCHAHYNQQRRLARIAAGTFKDTDRGYNRTYKGKYSVLKTRAKIRRLEVTISLEDHINLLCLPCHYCGGKLNETGYGLDRKDSDKGYTLENVVPCCHSCNTIKSNKLSYEEMIVAMTAVLDFRKNQKGNKNGKH